MLLAVAHPAQLAETLETAMLSNDKLFVVLAVVLIIWLGLAAFVFRTDRRIDRLEQGLQDLKNIPDS